MMPVFIDDINPPIPFPMTLCPNDKFCPSVYSQRIKCSRGSNAYPREQGRRGGAVHKEEGRR